MSNQQTGDMLRSEDPQWMWDLYHGSEQENYKLNDFLASRMFTAIIVLTFVLTGYALFG